MLVVFEALKATVKGVIVIYGVLRHIIGVVIGTIRELVVDTGFAGAIYERLKTSVLNVWMVFKQNLLPTLKRLMEALRPFKPVLDVMVKVFGTLLLVAILAVITAIELILTVAIQLITWIADHMVKGIEEAIKKWDNFTSALSKVVDALKEVWDWAKKAAREVGAGFRNVGANIAQSLGFSAGGIVPGAVGAPTMALVHGGERITPAAGLRSPGGNGNVLHITITGNNITNENDAERLAQLVGREVMSAIREKRTI